MTVKIPVVNWGIRLWQKIHPAWKFSIVSVTLMRGLYTFWSLVFLSSFSMVVQNQEFFGEPVLTLFDLKTSQLYAYNRFVDNSLLSFQYLDGNYFVDNETGSIWQISDGKCISGFYAGKFLSPANITNESLFPYHGISAHAFPSIAIWQRFDANWYLVIAQNGYGHVPGDVHFPPLYAILIRMTSVILRDDVLSALLIAQLALYYLVKLLYDLFAQWGDEWISQKALLFLLIFPTSFFLFSAYTEAIFMIFVLLCLKAMENGKWPWAGLWMFCAILVRLQGVALLLPFVWGLLQTRLRNVKFIDLFFGVLGPVVAIGLYLLIRAKGGDPSVIPFTETNLHARIVPPWENVIYSVQYIFNGLAGYIDILNLMTFILFSVSLVANWKKFPVEYGLFSAASIVLLTMRLVDTQPLNSMIRYLLTVFPAFYLFGMLAENEWMKRLMVVSFLILNLFLSAQFFLWGWVA